MNDELDNAMQLLPEAACFAPWYCIFAQWDSSGQSVRPLAAPPSSTEPCCGGIIVYRWVAGWTGENGTGCMRVSMSACVVLVFFFSLQHEWINLSHWRARPLSVLLLVRFVFLFCV